MSKKEMCTMKLKNCIQVLILSLSLLYGVVYNGQVRADWVIQTVDGDDDVGEYNSLALDNGGNPHISYYDISQEAIKYARKGPLASESTISLSYYWLAPILVAVIILASSILIIRNRRKRDELLKYSSENPEDPPQFPCNESGQLCPDCNEPLTFILKERDWRCKSCEDDE